MTECVWNEEESRVVVQQSYNEKDGKSNVLIDKDSNLDHVRGTSLFTCHRYINTYCMYKDYLKVL